VEHEARDWVRLRIRPQAHRRFAIGLSDSTGRRIPVPGTARPRPGVVEHHAFLGDAGPVVFAVPDEVSTWVAGLVADLPDHRLGPTTDRTLLPVFVEVPPPFAHLDWEALLTDLLGTDRIVAVIDRPTSEAARFELPLRLLAVGERGAAALDALAARGSWLGLEPALQPQASLATLVETSDGARRVLRNASTDVLLVDAWDAAVLAGARLGRDAVRLAVILTDAVSPSVEFARGLTFARSALVLGGPADQLQLNGLVQAFDALAHDLPLHEVTAATANAMGSSRWIRLVASPGSLHDLRLVDAWSAIVAAGQRLRGAVGAGDLDQAAPEVIEVLDATSDLTLFTHQREIFHEAIEGSAMLEVDFARESLGLHPLAFTRARLATAHDLARRVAAQVGSTAPSGPDATDPDRVVNLGLRRRGARHPDDPSLYVERSATVVAGAAYDLDVQIGAPWPDGIVIGERASIDLLLPDDQTGHVLDVAVMSTDAVVLGSTVRRLHLPPRGASELVSFSVRMPPTPGPAELRVSVYHRDHLVQTYRLTTTVTDGAACGLGEETTVARCEHSATARFGNLDGLGPRRVSLTFNANGPGTHTMFAKAGDAAAAVTVDPTAQRDLAGDIRTLLTEVIDGQLDATEALRALAKRGYDLATAIKHQLHGEALAHLNALRTRHDDDIQVVRLHPQYSVPWALLYDWPPPEEVFGGPPIPVCFGAAADGTPCGHAVGVDVICARGFWGVRHRVEELLGDPRALDLQTEVPLRPLGIAIGLGVVDTATQTLVADLGTRVDATRLHALTAADDLVDLLFDDARRPAVLTIIGHRETGEIIGEPEGERIGSGTADGWFIPKRLDRRSDVDGAVWGVPNTIVLLLACATTSVMTHELTSALSTLAHVRASGIVGTECDIYSDFAARVASDLVDALARPAGATPRRSFAEAVREVRARLVVEERDVRGFALTAFGPSDTSLVDA
jgi:hypothetical protein